MYSGEGISKLSLVYSKGKNRSARVSHTRWSSSGRLRNRSRTISAALWPLPRTVTTFGRASDAHGLSIGSRANRYLLLGTIRFYVRASSVNTSGWYGGDPVPNTSLSALIVDIPWAVAADTR